MKFLLVLIGLVALVSSFMFVSAQNVSLPIQPPGLLNQTSNATSTAGRQKRQICPCGLGRMLPRCPGCPFAG